MRTSPLRVAAAGFALWALGTAALADCAADVADLRGPSGQVRLSVEIVDTVEERAQGLMFRESLPQFGGMLFVYDAPEAVSFWMKNTLIPLDMLFFDARGVLTRVHENAVPGDLTPISGGEDVQFVIEVLGGTAKRLGIAPGTELRHPAVDPTAAVWPCPDTPGE